MQYILVNYKEDNVLENAIIKYSENGLIDSSFGVNGTAPIPSVSNSNTTFNFVKQWKLFNWSHTNRPCNWVIY